MLLVLSYSYSMKWYSYSYSKRSSIAIHPIRLQITVNRFDQPSASAVQTAIEYEYRCTEYRFAEYEYEEVRCDARTYVSPTIIPEEPHFSALSFFCPTRLPSEDIGEFT